jgi:hypothetical protein
VPDRCAEVARSHGEPVGGSASRARRWLLVEQPGAWGRDAIRESGLPSEVADHLERLHRDLPARILVIRRTARSGLAAQDALGPATQDAPGLTTQGAPDAVVPGGDPLPERDDPSDGNDRAERRSNRSPRTVFAGVSLPSGGGWLERFHLDDIGQLLDLDLSGLSSGRSVGGELVDDPLYLVCTNGKHDACCATFGLPVAKAVTEQVGDRAWECSHVGGDRFAGNLVCLPDGILYGHLDPSTAVAAVQAHEDGRIMAAHCRGRSALPFPVQAAELLARERLGLSALDEVRYLDAGRTDDLVRVRFALPDQREIVATVRCGRAADARVMTCGTSPQAPPTHELVELIEVAASGGATPDPRGTR